MFKSDYFMPLTLLICFTAGSFQMWEPFDKIFLIAAAFLGDVAAFKQM